MPMSKFYHETDSEDESMDASSQKRGSRFNQDFIEQSVIGEGHFGSVVSVINKLDGIEYAIKITYKPSQKGRPEIF